MKNQPTPSHNTELLNPFDFYVVETHPDRSFETELCLEVTSDLFITNRGRTYEAILKGRKWVGGGHFCRVGEAAPGLTFQFFDLGLQTGLFPISYCIIRKSN